MSINMIYEAASVIAGDIFTSYCPLELQLEVAILGTDLTSEDRLALRLLLDAETGVTSDLMDSDTAEKIRDATVEEAVASALARPTGHICVDGRTCYVQL